jgi:hypothetical protein
MKRDRLAISRFQSVETYVDWSGRVFIAYSSGVSIIVRNVKELRKFLGLAPKTPSRESLDSWLVSLAAIDDERQSRKTQQTTGLTEAVLQTGFGPECHLDETDPNHQTRTVI